MQSTNPMIPPNPLALHTTPNGAVLDQEKEYMRSANVVLPQKQKGRMFKAAVLATIAFFLLSHSVAYRFMNNVWSIFSSNMNELLNEEGCPTQKGMLFQTAVFFMFMIYILMF